MSRTRHATQVFAIAVLAALLAAPLTSAATGPPVQSKQAVRALVVRSHALDRRYRLGAHANATERISVSQPKGFGTTAGGAPLSPGAQDVSGS